MKVNGYDILPEANLRGADLRWADLRWADLSGAYLRGADLSKANLGEADLRGATYPAGSLDPRVYSLHVIFHPNRLGFISGCQAFDCLEDAVAHWGAANYHTPSIGRSYVAQCTMLDTLYKAGDLPLCQPWNEE